MHNIKTIAPFKNSKPMKRKDLEQKLFEKEMSAEVEAYEVLLRCPYADEGLVALTMAEVQMKWKRKKREEWRKTPDVDDIIFDARRRLYHTLTNRNYRPRRKTKPSNTAP